jgi:putative ABC transport system permease protein
VPLLAWKNLLEDRGRFIVGLAGIIFAVALVTIQTGIYEGFLNSSSVLIDDSKADLWVTAQELRYFELTLPLPYADLAKARAVSGVDRAEAMEVQTSVFKGHNHHIELIRVVGFDPDGTLFRPGPVSDAELRQLHAPDSVIVDRVNQGAFQLSGLGDTGQIGLSTVHVVAFTQGTQPLVSADFVFTSLPNAEQYLKPQMPSMPMFLGLGEPPASSSLPAPTLTGDDQISYIMIKAAPRADLGALAARLEHAIPDTRAYTHAQMDDVTRDYWKQRTGIGFVLGIGALVGIIVGMVVVGQILYSSVSDHIKEYGTMKAMGASDRALYQIIIIQAALMAAFGFIPGLGVAFAVAGFSMLTHGVLILITPVSSAFVLAITLAMCLLSGGFAMHRVTRVDPAVVFKS